MERLRVSAVLGAIQAHCKSNRIQLVLEEKDSPRTDGTRVFLQHPGLTELGYTEYMFRAYHEAGHCFGEGRLGLELLKKSKVSSPLGDVWNFLEDIRQENSQHGEFYGKDRTMEEGHALFYESNLEEQCSTTQGRTITALCIWQYSKFYPTFEKFLGTFEGAEFVDGINPFSDEWSVLGSSAEECLETARVLTDLLFPPTEEEDEGKGDEKGEGDEDGECDGDGDPSKSESDGSDGEGESRESGEEIVKEILRTLESSSTLPRVRGETTYYSELPESRIPPQTLGEAKYDHEKFVPASPSEWVIIDWKSRVPSGKPYCGLVVRDNHIAMEESIIHSSGLSNRLRRVLQANEQKHTLHGQRSGKLSSKSIWRAAVPQLGDEYSSRIHKREQIRTGMDTAISIQMDCSSSMLENSKAGVAAACLILLNRTLSVISRGVSYSLEGYTENRIVSGGTPVPFHYIFKDYNQVVSEVELKERFHAVEFNQNSDGESLNIAYQRLKTVPRNRKILLVLSDGYPCCTRNGRVKDFSRDIIKEIEADKDVEVYAVGLKSYSVAEYYSKYSILNDISELEATLINIVNKFI